MLFRLFSFISICVFLIYSPAYSQELSNFREKVLLVESDTLLLDSLSIIPGYLIIEKQNVPIDTSEFQVDYEKSMLIFKKNAPKKDSITIKYRVFPINFTKEYYHKNRKQIEPDQAGIYNPFYYSSSKENKDVFGSGSLSKQGSISRGVSFGNNRDLSVNSNMNLQLSGRVSDNINILAAITDDNIPVQAEGNTQQLQDFDQVYIQLYNDNSRLTAGDFQLKSPNSYYMKYFKKAQGGSFNTIVPVSTNNNSGIMDIQASAAISRGKFSRNIVQGIEGNQGPYRLKGAENETFIIILSGTERVYIDGHLLTRGQENDYIIDYNLAEISFTAKQLITKDKRIIIEFQYSDRNYARSLVQVSDIYKKGKSSVWFNFYSEQDAKNQPLQLDLNEEQRIFLANIGDSLQDALVNKIDSVPFSSDFVLYRMVVPDSLGYDSVFVYSTNPELARYKLVFSNVGEGRGNYRQIKSTANGKVFEWVAPDTINGLIIKRGSFEPVIQLITPKQKQMITLGTETYIAKNTLLKTEFSGTNNDINTFSAKDSKDDLGYAIMINVETKKRIGKESEKPMNLFYGAGYEQLSKNFSYIEWFRSAEFDRDWNLRNRTISGEQYIPSVFLGVEKEQVGKLSYNANSYISENDFTGLQSLLTANISSRGWKINMTGSIMNSEGKQNSSVFMRNKGVVSKSFKRITLGFRDDIEDNRFYIDKKDSLLSNSYKFSEWEFFISNLDTAKNKYMLSYIQRSDFVAKENTLLESTLGKSVVFSYDLAKNKNHILRGKSSYRMLETDSTLTAIKNENTILNRIEYSLKVLKGVISYTSFYEIGSGQEVKKEFSYIEVPAGQGIYSWTDYNSNGIKELGEFETAAFQDQAKYIRVFTPTTEFIKTRSNQFSQNVFISPAVAWNNKTGVKKIISRFSNQFAYRIDRKTQGEKPETAFNPFYSDIADTMLVTLNSSFRNSVYFNRTSSVFGATYNHQNIAGKSILINGAESRQNFFNELDLRYNILTDYMINLLYSNGEKSNFSEFFLNRNYKIKNTRIEPKITYQPGTKYRISFSYEQAQKINNIEYGGQISKSKKAGTEFRLNSAGKGSIQLNANYIIIDFKNADGSVISGSSPLTFEMLEGLQPGKNATWTLVYQRNLANNMQISINYNGRISEANSAIHSGGVQIRAFF